MALDPLDDRYLEYVKELLPFAGEFAIFKYRLIVEIRYLRFLVRLLEGKDLDIDFSVSERDFERYKKIEAELKHDIKALEYFLREKLKTLGLAQYERYVHLGLTSDDVNSLAYSLLLRDVLERVLLPLLQDFKRTLYEISLRHKDTPIIARTHGQKAVPTTFGREMYVFYKRLERIKVPSKIYVKFGGAIGTFASFYVIDPKINWEEELRRFIESFNESKYGIKLEHWKYTKQPPFYDSWIEIFQWLYNVATILLDLAKDIWLYAMLGYIIFVPKGQQVGSSTMPQKNNPVEFETAEGALVLARNYLELFIRELPVTRLQRHLADSIIRRNILLPIAYIILAIKKMLEGFGKIHIKGLTIRDIIEKHLEVLSEGIQLWLRRHGDERGYERVRQLILEGNLKELKKLLPLEELYKIAETYIRSAAEQVRA